MGTNRRVGSMAVAGALALGSLLLACGGEETTPPPMSPPPPPPAASVAPAPTDIATAAAPTTTAAPTAAPAAPTGTPEQAEGEQHRRRHGGMLSLIAMSLHDLDLSDDQKAAVEKIRSDLVTKLAPVRTAGADFANVLADGVAAGAVDRAKADKAIDKLVKAAAGVHDASADAINQLHAVLNTQQRATLVDKLSVHWENWKEAQGQDEQDQPKDKPKNRNGHMLALVRDLGLSNDQAQQIKTKFQALMKANPQDHAHKEVQDHLKAFGTAFKADSFDAKKLPTATAANTHMAKWGATRMARFLEAAAPVLTVDQRAKLSQQIRARGNAPTS
jgi:Spy/CpxP family protein refolding chaperone